MNVCCFFFLRLLFVSYHHHDLQFTLQLLTKFTQNIEHTHFYTQSEKKLQKQSTIYMNVKHVVEGRSTHLDNINILHLLSRSRVYFQRYTRNTTEKNTRRLFCLLYNLESRI